MRPEGAGSDAPIGLVPVDACPLCGQPATAELVAALGELVEPTKAGSATIKSERGQYSYRYLELPDLLTAVRAALAPHHLAVMQEVANAERDVVVTTVLLHASGRQFRSPPITLRSGGSAQDIGSASTYGRRYSLAAMVGLAGDLDDDGQQASVKRPEPPEPPPTDAPAHGHVATERSVKAMWTMLRKTGMDDEQIRGWVGTVLQIPPDWSTATLTQGQVSSIINRLTTELQEAGDA